MLLLDLPRSAESFTATLSIHAVHGGESGDPAIRQLRTLSA
jgi:hypothetical protein